MRTIVDLTERQLSELDRLAKVRDTSRADLVRRAVDRYLAEDAPNREAGFGLWKRGGSKEDGLAFQRRIRKSWQP